MENFYKEMESAFAELESVKKLEGEAQLESFQELAEKISELFSQGTEILSESVISGEEPTFEVVEPQPSIFDLIEALETEVSGLKDRVAKLENIEVTESEVKKMSESSLVELAIKLGLTASTKDAKADTLDKVLIKLGFKDA